MAFTSPIEISEQLRTAKLLEKEMNPTICGLYRLSRSRSNCGSRFPYADLSAHGSITIFVTFSFLSRQTLYISGASSNVMRCEMI